MPQNTAVARTYLSNAIEWFEPHAKPEESKRMEAYMRNQFSFLGIRTPELRHLMRSFLKENGLPSMEHLADVIQGLWQRPEREYQNVALFLLQKSLKQFSSNQLSLLEYTIKEKPWWDTVDVIAVHLVGGFFLRCPEWIEPTVEKWLHSDHLWLQRTCILFQLHYKERTDTVRLASCIEHCMESNEFFIQKSIGWALREYGKTNPEWVVQFVSDHPSLKPLSRREAMKHLGKRQ